VPSAGERWPTIMGEENSVPGVSGGVVIMAFVIMLAVRS
jgi:hypothetical protein